MKLTYVGLHVTHFDSFFLKIIFEISESGNGTFGTTETPLKSETSRAGYTGGTNYQELYHHSHKLRKNSQWGEVNHDWVKCWDAPEIDLEIKYTWHPIAHTREKESRHADVNKEMEKAEKAMLKSRNSKKIPFKRTTSTIESVNSVESRSMQVDAADQPFKSKTSATVMFDPTSLDPDEISVEFTLKPGSTLFLYGSLLHHFVAIKVNIFNVLLPFRSVGFICLAC